MKKKIVILSIFLMFKPIDAVEVDKSHWTPEELEADRKAEELWYFKLKKKALNGDKHAAHALYRAYIYGKRDPEKAVFWAILYQKNGGEGADKLIAAAQEWVDVNVKEYLLEVETTVKNKKSSKSPK